jgi:uncharacterized membrane protein
MQRLCGTFLGFAFLGAVLVAMPAEAQFSVCNQSPKTARVAVGHWDNFNYVTEGWWTVPPGSCTITHPESLRWQWYYVYGETEADGAGQYDIWSGNIPLCIDREDQFKIVGNTDCDTGFIEIDAGLSKEWTFTLQ